MADINDYIENLHYEFTANEKALMDIYAECWEHCNKPKSCLKCKYTGDNDGVKMLMCMSYQYAQRLIDAGYEKTVHCKDCRHYENSHCNAKSVVGIPIFFCSPNDYCSDGELK